MTLPIAIVSTGTANIASVQAALRRLACSPHETSDPRTIADEDLVVLPGVGAFAAAMQSLEQAGALAALKTRIAAGRPTLCICLGLQILGEASAESPGVAGLAILPVQVERLADSQRVPQMGWNSVKVDDGTRLLASGHAYFANSYAIDASRYAEALRNQGWRLGITAYGRDMIAAIERGSVLACQFHPELSGPFGHSLLARWLEQSTRGQIAC